MRVCTCTYVHVCVPMDTHMYVWGNGYIHLCICMPRSGVLLCHPLPHETGSLTEPGDVFQPG